MATFDLDHNSATYQIRGYDERRIQINDSLYETSLIVSNHTLLTDWPVRTINELTLETLQPIIKLKPDIVLIGTGRTHLFLNASLLTTLMQAGIQAEVMSTPAACRTYQALTAENRQVAAALLLSV